MKCVLSIFAIMFRNNFITATAVVQAEGLSSVILFPTVAKIGYQGKIIQNAQGKCIKSVHWPLTILARGL